MKIINPVCETELEEETAFAQREHEEQIFNSIRRNASLTTQYTSLNLTGPTLRSGKLVAE